MGRVQWLFRVGVAHTPVLEGTAGVAGPMVHLGEDTGRHRCRYTHPLPDRTAPQALAWEGTQAQAAWACLPRFPLVQL